MNPARRGSVVVGREAWSVLEHVGGASLLDDARNAVSPTEQMMSLRAIDDARGAHVEGLGAVVRRGVDVGEVVEHGNGISVAIRDAKIGADELLEAEGFLDATGGKSALGSDPRFLRHAAQGLRELLPAERTFVTVQAPAIDVRGVGWTAGDEAFAINDRAEGVVSAFAPVTLTVDRGSTGINGTVPTTRVADELLASLSIDPATKLGPARTFTARQTIADHAAVGHRLLAGDSVRTVMPATQGGTSLALTDGERAARTILEAHAAVNADEAAAVVARYDAQTVAIHTAFIY